RSAPGAARGGREVRGLAPGSPRGAARHHGLVADQRPRRSVVRRMRAARPLLHRELVAHLRALHPRQDDPGVVLAARGVLMKVALVCSSGGHLAQLHRLEPWWRDHERLWVTFDTPEAVALLAGERTVWAHHPTTRNLPNAWRNLVLARRVLRTER